MVADRDNRLSEYLRAAIPRNLWVLLDILRYNMGGRGGGAFLSVNREWQALRSIQVGRPSFLSWLPKT